MAPPNSIWMRAISTDLCVLAWARWRTPIFLANSPMRFTLRSKASRSTISAGVWTSSNGVPIAAGTFRPTTCVATLSRAFILFLLAPVHPRRLHDDLHPLPGETHRLDDLVFTRQQNVFDMLRYEMPRQPSRLILQPEQTYLQLGQDRLQECQWQTLAPAFWEKSLHSPRQCNGHPCSRGGIRHQQPH